MKKCLVCVLILSLISCSKKSDDTIKITSLDQLNGVWKWESTCGGITDNCTNSSKTTYATITFNSNGTFVEKHNDTIYQQSNYTLVKNNDISGTLSLGNTDYKYPVYIVNNQLKITRGELADLYTKTK